MNSQQQQQYRMFGIDPRAVGYAAIPALATMGATYLEDASDDRFDRQAVRLAGNLTGGVAGYKLVGGGIPGAIAGTVGALGGGFISDRVADMVDPTRGRVSPEELIAAHLESDPIAQQAYYQEQIRQARLMQKEIQRQKMLEYQAQMGGGM